MEYCPGLTMQAHCSAVVDRKERLDDQQVWSVFAQLCGALRYLHQDLQVVHRDLSPKNVMIQGRSQLLAKLTDFGLAAEEDRAALQSTVGTILYCCPEIVQHQAYTEKADIWSLGCLLYKLAMMQDPFPGNNPLSVARKIVECSYAPVTRSAGLQGVVTACLCVDPNARADVGQVLALSAPALSRGLDAALGAFADGLSIRSVGV